MAFNLTSTVNQFFTPELIGKAASYLGETDSVVQKGLKAIIPASLLGIINKAESGNPETLLNLSREAYNSGILNNPGGGFTAGGGGIPADGPALITNLFGDRFGGLANAISSFTGLKGSSTASLFGSIIPLILGLLGKQAKDHSLTPNGLVSLLGSEKNAILGMIPAGLNLGGLFSATRREPSPTAERPTLHEEKKATNWLWPILAIVALALIAWLLSRGCNKTEPASTTVTIHDTLVNTKTDTVVVGKEPVKLRLPNGVEIDAYKGGIEDLLIVFLSDPGAKAGKDNWFDFHDLNFQFGTAEIIPESRNEVDNIAQILKAFPNAKIKIGGYTDKVGDEAANKKLSKERADAVTAALTAAGVGAQLEGAEGYGSEFAHYPASAPEADRIKDRRVSVSVRAK